MQVFKVPVDKSRRETTVHGTPSFPVAVYKSAKSLNLFGDISWHWHEELQFCIVDRGRIRFFVGEDQFELSEGEGIFINQDLLHCAKLLDDSDSSYLCLNFAQIILYGFPGSSLYQNYIKPYQGDIGLGSVLLSPDFSWQRAILQGILEINEFLETKVFGYEYEVYRRLSEMWIQLLKHKPTILAHGNSHKVSHNQAVQNIIQYIENHYTERITLEMIAQDISFCPAECCRFFKRFTGMTIFTYLNNYRLSQAVIKLSNNNVKISQVAIETGFCSTSHFIEIFRKKFLMTPRQYWKSVQR